MFDKLRFDIRVKVGTDSAIISIFVYGKLVNKVWLDTAHVPRLIIISSR